MHGRYCKVALHQGLLELFDFLPRIAKDQSLVEVKLREEVKEHVHLPLLILNGNLVVGILKREFLSHNKDLGGVF